MSDELIAALTGVVERVRALAAGDAELRTRLRALASAILAEPAAPEPASAPTMAAAPEAVAAPAPASAPAPDAAAEAGAGATPGAAPAAATESVGPPVLPPAAPRPSPEPSYYTAPEFAPVAGRPFPETTDAELPLIESRCRLKAEGARWAATRRRRLAEGVDFRTDVEPLDREIIERAKSLPDCFLWMCHPSGPNPAELSQYEDLAGCFDAVASAISLLRGLLGDVDENGDAFEQALTLTAEAQSALRRAVDLIGGGTDKDQQKVYNWLRAATSLHQLYIPRHMRADDPADPAAWADLDARIGHVDAQLQEARQREKRRQAALKRLRYHLKSIQAGAGGSADHAHDWRKVVESVREMVADGVPPSNAELRELLLPVIDDLPGTADLPQEFRLVMREVNRFLATRPPAPERAEAAAAAEPTAEVREAARLLGGRTVVLIGGERRPHAHHALQSTLGLKELDWVGTREHESVDSFEPHVARPDVALVILAIRWSSHAFGDVKQFCDTHGKPLVRLPAGYSPNQVAAQVLAQVSDRLKATNEPG